MFLSQFADHKRGEPAAERGERVRNAKDCTLKINLY